MKELWIEIDASLPENQVLLKSAAQTCDTVLVDAKDLENLKKFGIKAASTSAEADIVVLSVFDPEKVKELKAKGRTVAVKLIIEGKKDEETAIAAAELKLRVYIQGGGCSGFQYGFTFDEQILDGDTAIEKLGIQLLVDPMSIQYLTGAEIDYREDLSGAQFIIRNPNATTTCGCGSSFSV